MSKDAFYFIHDSNARNDEDILAMRMRLGWEGYGLFWAIIEKLRDASDYELSTDYNLIAYDLRTDAKTIKGLVEDFPMFTVSDDRKSFFSDRLKRDMQTKDEKSQKARESIKKRWNRQPPQNESNAPELPTYYETDTNVLPTYYDGNTKRKEEKRKEESKEEIKKIPTSVGIKESAADSGSTTKVDEAFSDSSTQSQKPPAAVPPPGSAAPPSTVVRDAAGIAICQELRSQLIEFHKSHADLYPPEMYTAFLRYWSEPNLKGTPRWITEKTTNKGRFDIPGRLATWNKNEQNGNSSRLRQTPSFNRGANPGLRPASLAEPKYQGKGNVREIEDL